MSFQAGRVSGGSAEPDPGLVTVRGLNQVEYRNTIRDLMGTDFQTEKSLRRMMRVRRSKFPLPGTIQLGSNFRLIIGVFSFSHVKVQLPRR